MKFYTKRWYMLMQEWGLSEDYIEIPDKKYTAKDIKKLYEEQLNKELEDEKKFTHDVEIDVEDSASSFDENYKRRLRYCKNFVPQWLYESVDHRLIALGYLPKSVYKRLNEEISNKKSEWDRIEWEALKKLKTQHIPKNISDALALHDSKLLSLKKSGKNVVMIVNKDGAWPEDRTPYRKVVFFDAKILEKDAGLRVRKYMNEGDGFFDSRTCFLYSEQYNEGDRYEIHMLFITSHDLAYLTINCRDMIFNDGIVL